VDQVERISEPEDKVDELAHLDNDKTKNKKAGMKHRRPLTH
jgi:hypothetical protein